MIFANNVFQLAKAGFSYKDLVSWAAFKKVNMQNLLTAAQHVSGSYKTEVLCRMWESREGREAVNLSRELPFAVPRCYIANSNNALVSHTA